jgi:hypothetical protein
LDGVTIDTYACSSELTIDYYNNNVIDGIGTICHEFSHCLGFPDMYDYTQKNFGMGDWDLMDRGCYNGDGCGFVPAGYSSYEKWCAGWLEPIELKDEDVEVTDLKPLSQGGDAYVIYNDKNPDEFYLLENRQNVNWDAELPGKGLLVLHADYDPEIWEWNVVNTKITKDNVQWPIAIMDKLTRLVYDSTCKRIGIHIRASMKTRITNIAPICRQTLIRNANAISRARIPVIGMHLIKISICTYIKIHGTRHNATLGTQCM